MVGMIMASAEFATYATLYNKFRLKRLVVEARVLGTSYTTIATAGSVGVL